MSTADFIFISKCISSKSHDANGRRKYISGNGYKATWFCFLYVGKSLKVIKVQGGFDKDEKCDYLQRMEKTLNKLMKQGLLKNIENIQLIKTGKYISYEQIQKVNKTKTNIEVKNIHARESDEEECFKKIEKLNKAEIDINNENSCVRKLRASKLREITAQALRIKIDEYIACLRKKSCLENAEIKTELRILGNSHFDLIYEKIKCFLDKEGCFSYTENKYPENDVKDITIENVFERSV